VPYDSAPAERPVVMPDQHLPDAPTVHQSRRPLAQALAIVARIRARPDLEPPTGWIKPSCASYR
jgi:hypothetical protein